jgi:hypothetical protein
MRLCNQYVSEVQRVDCMSHYRRYLSPACRAVFRGGATKKVRRFGDDRASFTRSSVLSYRHRDA